MKILLTFLLCSSVFAETYTVRLPSPEDVDHYREELGHKTVRVTKDVPPGRPVNSVALSCEQKVLIESQKEVMRGISMAKKNAALNEKGSQRDDRLVQLLGMCAGVSRSLGAAKVAHSAQDQNTDWKSVAYRSALSKLIFDTASLHRTESEVQDICFNARLAAQFEDMNFDAQSNFKRMGAILQSLESAVADDVKLTKGLK